jgi:hypothetical protein
MIAMTKMKQSTQPFNQGKRERDRGVILTHQGLVKLQDAKQEAEYRENRGNRYTLETLSACTQLSCDTVMKVLACEEKVDKSTLKKFFAAFALSLEAGDYYKPQATDKRLDLSPVDFEPKLPEGQLALGSPFYIERPTIEEECYQTVLQAGALIRIKAPRRMGKTSLMERILDRATKEGCHGVSLSLQMADSDRFENLDKFLRWFCACITQDLQLPKCLDDYWDDLFGSKISCKIYFEQCLLAKIDRPLVLGLDDVDRLFQYPDLADDFFSLLRAWHEDAKNREIWKKLRLVVAHSTEVYIPLNLNQSPFNVGLPIELPEFSSDRIQLLAQRYGLDWSEQEVEQLMSLVGGHPYLVQLTLYHLWRQDITLEQLLEMLPNDANSIYRPYLQEQLANLQDNDSNLAAAFAKVVSADRAIELDLLAAYKLQSLGLIHFQGKQVIPSCQLYAQYFRHYFNGATDLTGVGNRELRVGNIHN